MADMQSQMVALERELEEKSRLWQAASEHSMLRMAFAEQLKDLQKVGDSGVCIWRGWEHCEAVA